MEFNRDTIKRIEVAMGFKLYAWQKIYLEDDTFQLNTKYRKCGNTTIYTIKKLLSLDEPVNLNTNDISKLIDYKSTERMSIRINRDIIKRINNKLIEVGFKTCAVDSINPMMEVIINDSTSETVIKCAGSKVDIQDSIFYAHENGTMVIVDEEVSRWCQRLIMDQVTKSNNEVKWRRNKREIVKSSWLQ